jgi:hypothetical protein
MPAQGPSRRRAGPAGLYDADAFMVVDGSDPIGVVARHGVLGVPTR